MNKTQLAKRRREQIEAAVLSAVLFALLFFAWHWGWIERLNPFDGL